MVKKEIRLAATPVTATTMPIAAPAIVDAPRGTPGIIVEKQLPTMNAQKHVGGMEAMTKKKNMAEATGPSMSWITVS